MRYCLRFTVVCLLSLLALAMPSLSALSRSNGAVAAGEQVIVVPASALHLRSDNGVVDYKADAGLSVHASTTLSNQRRAQVVSWYKQMLPQLFKALDWNKHRINAKADVRFLFAGNHCSVDRCTVTAAGMTNDASVVEASLACALDRINGRHGFRPALPADVESVAMNGRLEIDQEKHPVMTFGGLSETADLRTYRLRVLRNLRRSWDAPGANPRHIFVDIDIDAAGGVHNPVFCSAASERDMQAAMKALRKSTPFWVPPEGVPSPLKARIEFPPY